MHSSVTITHNFHGDDYTGTFLLLQTPLYYTSLYSNLIHPICYPKSPYQPSAVSGSTVRPCVLAPSICLGVRASSGNKAHIPIVESETVACSSASWVQRTLVRTKSSSKESFRVKSGWQPWLSWHCGGALHCITLYGHSLSTLLARIPPSLYSRSLFTLLARAPLPLHNLCSSHHWQGHCIFFIVLHSSLGKDTTISL